MLIQLSNEISMCHQVGLEYLICNVLSISIHNGIDDFIFEECAGDLRKLSKFLCDLSKVDGIYIHTYICIYIYICTISSSGDGTCTSVEGYRDVISFDLIRSTLYNQLHIHYFNHSNISRTYDK